MAKKQRDFTQEERDAIWRKIQGPKNGLTADEFKDFLLTCKARQLDPLKNQIHLLKQGNRCVYHVGIDGYRKIGMETGLVEGIKRHTEWRIPEGQSMSYQDSLNFLYGCVAITIKGWKEPVYEECSYRESVQKSRDGVPTPVWSKMPELMTKKVAESMAWRLVAPNELAGLYTSEEVTDVPETPDKPDASIFDAPDESNGAPVEKPDEYPGNNYEPPQEDTKPVEPPPVEPDVMDVLTKKDHNLKRLTAAMKGTGIVKEKMIEVTGVSSLKSASPDEIESAMDKVTQYFCSQPDELKEVFINTQVPLLMKFLGLENKDMEAKGLSIWGEARPLDDKKKIFNGLIKLYYGIEDTPTEPEPEPQPSDVVDTPEKLAEEFDGKVVEETKNDEGGVVHDGEEAPY